MQLDRADAGGGGRVGSLRLAGSAASMVAVPRPASKPPALLPCNPACHACPGPSEVPEVLLHPWLCSTPGGPGPAVPGSTGV